MKTKKQQKNMGIIEFLTKRFPDEETAVKFFVEKRWSDGVVCPYCASDVVYNVKGKQPYKCSKCNRKFTAKTKTIMEGSPVPVRTWLLAMYIMGTARKGISSIQLAKELGVTQKTAWYMAHRIREACDEFEKSKMRGIIEVDEAYFGGKEKNKHAHKKLKGRGVANKTAVVALRERKGSVRGKVVHNTQSHILQGLVIQNVLPNSSVFTDDHKGYTGLGRRGFQHSIVKHSLKEYVDGMAHTNGIESFWALLKRGVYGTYHNVSKKHLQRYVNEFSFRSNNGDLALSFVEAVCRQVNGNALQYKQLTK